MVVKIRRCLPPSNATSIPMSRGFKRSRWPPRNCIMRSLVVFSWHGPATGKGGTGKQLFRRLRLLLCCGQIQLLAITFLHTRITRCLKVAQAESQTACTPPTPSFPGQSLQTSEQLFPVPPFPIARPCQENMSEEWLNSKKNVKSSCIAIAVWQIDIY